MCEIQLHIIAFSGAIAFECQSITLSRKYVFIQLIDVSVSNDVSENIVEGTIPALQDEDKV